MNCNEFWRRYNIEGLSPELEEHLKGCLSCENELLIERELDKTVGRLPVYLAPDHAWDRIAASMENTESIIPEKQSVFDRVHTILRNVFPGSLSLRPAVVWLIVAVMTTSAGTYYMTRTFYPFDGEAKRMRAAHDLDDAEREYLTAIEKFSQHVEDNKNNIDPELYDLYIEKLAILDEYIERCSEAVEENEFNPNARMYLALAYREKAETLKEMAGKL